MSGNETKAININHELHQRALAYAANNPGVSVTEAKGILVGKDAKNGRVAKSHRAAKGK